MLHLSWGSQNFIVDSSSFVAHRVLHSGFVVPWVFITTTDQHRVSSSRTSVIFLFPLRSKSLFFGFAWNTSSPTWQPSSSRSVDECWERPWNLMLLAITLEFLQVRVISSRIQIVVVEELSFISHGRCYFLLWLNLLKNLRTWPPIVAVLLLAAAALLVLLVLLRRWCWFRRNQFLILILLVMSDTPSTSYSNHICWI